MGHILETKKFPRDIFPHRVHVPWGRYRRFNHLIPKEQPSWLPEWVWRQVQQHLGGSPSASARSEESDMYAYEYMYSGDNEDEDSLRRQDMEERNEHYEEYLHILGSDNDLKVERDDDAVEHRDISDVSYSYAHEDDYDEWEALLDEQDDEESVRRMLLMRYQDLNEHGFVDGYDEHETDDFAYDDFEDDEAEEVHYGDVFEEQEILDEWMDNDDESEWVMIDDALAVDTMFGGTDVSDDSSWDTLTKHIRTLKGRSVQRKCMNVFGRELCLCEFMHWLNGDNEMSGQTPHLCYDKQKDRQALEDMSAIHKPRVAGYDVWDDETKEERGYDKKEKKKMLEKKRKVRLAQKQKDAKRRKVLKRNKGRLKRAMWRNRKAQNMGMGLSHKPRAAGYDFWVDDETPNKKKLLEQRRKVRLSKKQNEAARRKVLKRNKGRMKGAMWRERKAQKMAMKSKGQVGTFPRHRPLWLPHVFWHALRRAQPIGQKQTPLNAAAEEYEDVNAYMYGYADYADDVDVDEEEKDAMSRVYAAAVMDEEDAMDKLGGWDDDDDDEFEDDWSDMEMDNEFEYDDDEEFNYEYDGGDYAVDEGYDAFAEYEDEYASAEEYGESVPAGDVVLESKAREREEVSVQSGDSALSAVYWPLELAFVCLVGVALLSMHISLTKEDDALKYGFNRIDMLREEDEEDEEYSENADRDKLMAAATDSDEYGAQVSGDEHLQ